LGILQFSISNIFFFFSIIIIITLPVTGRYTPEVSNYTYFLAEDFLSEDWRFYFPEYGNQLEISGRIKLKIY